MNIEKQNHINMFTLQIKIMYQDQILKFTYFIQIPDEFTLLANLKLYLLI